MVPSDYYLFPKLKEHLAGTRFSNKDETTTKSAAAAMRIMMKAAKAIMPNLHNHYHDEELDVNHVHDIKSN
ncbi:Hypothetical predicted protein [Octopus vulgaris]|uniref:Uncharacterized protein n=1 Tax=Octopus vulgaris TaxID=6645 RepID=A0AA36B3A1_OCTVU|nr:Hypothetical predicted protein [Octopus vulgaris]